MKVLIVNGSPGENGNTMIAIQSEKSHHNKASSLYDGGVGLIFGFTFYIENERIHRRQMPHG